MRFALRSPPFAVVVPVVGLFLSLLLLPAVVVGQSRLPPCSNAPPVRGNCQGTEQTTEYRYVGEFKDGYFEGQGVMTHVSGDKYVGEFKFGAGHGQGTYTFVNGDKYVGEFKDGKWNGQGTYAIVNAGIYVGEFRDGNFNGQGTLTFVNGKKYVGEFKNGMNGQGTLTYPDGRKYVGEIKGGKSNGQGTLTYPDGRKYVGGFKEDEPSGQGTYTNAPSALVSAGNWAYEKVFGGAKTADQEAIRMEEHGGVYVVPVRFNDTITLDAIIDSGASDVSIPFDIVLTLIRTKTVTDRDFLGNQTYVLADGSTVPSPQFRIRLLKVGNKTIQNVVASIVPIKGEILLGQSFLSKFKSWSVDNEQHALVLR